MSIYQGSKKDKKTKAETVDQMSVSKTDQETVELVKEAPTESVTVEEMSPVEEVVEKPVTYGKVDSSTGLNFRTKADSTASIIRVLSNGEKVKIVDTVGGFFKVEDASGTEGYAMSKFIVLV